MGTTYVKSPLACFAESAESGLVIAGEWKVVDGMPIGVDLEELRARHGAAARAFL